MKKISFNQSWSFVVLVLLTVVIAASAQAADKLIVMDSGGTNPVFRVDEFGTVEVPGGLIWDNTNKRLGIATSSPLSTLHIVEQNGLNSDRGVISSQHYDGVTAAVFQYKRSRGTFANPTALANGDAIGAFHFWGNDGSNYQAVASIRAMVNGTVQAGSVPGELWFQTGNNSTTTWAAPKMVISTSGNVGIGTSTPSHLIQLSGGAYSNGAVWTNASSRELKENINGLTSTEAMSALAGLSPVKYNYKAEKDQQHVGFIAEDVPDLVATKDRKGLSPMDIVAVLTKVVQEQQSTISQLSEKVSQLQREMKLRGSLSLNE